MTIAQEVTKLRSQLPDNDVMRTFERDRERLAASPAPEIPAGTALPAADLLDPHGVPTTLAGAVAGAPAVIVFYRGAWCPYCNLTLRAYASELVPELRRRGVGLIAISPQAPDGSLTMAEKNELDFPVLSDVGGEFAEALGIRFEPAAEVSAAQRGLGVDLTELNGDGTTRLPMPTVLVVDDEAVVRWAQVTPDYTGRTEATEIIAAVDATLQPAAG